MNDADTLVSPLIVFPAASRLRTLVDAHYSFLHRSLRRLGVPDAKVEDAAQQVLLVVARRLPAIADGAERSFLFSVAARVASELRRSQSRLREVHDDELLAAHHDDTPEPEEAIDEARARVLLFAVLDRLPLDLRTVFVLADLEETTMTKIAELLQIPPGTVASRLRRAREAFAAEASKMKARLDAGGRR